jgi:hypothetical protein
MAGEGRLIAQGLKAKLARWVKATNEATQWVANNWCIWSPIEATRHLQASYLSLERAVSITPLRVGWH